MAALAKPNLVTVPEYLAWAENQPEGRFELHDGVIIGMAPERVGHVHAKFAVAAALKDAIRKAGVPCQAFVDGLGVQIDEWTSYIPDALVNCGERLPLDAMLAPAPVIVVEVLSPSTQGHDRIRKLFNYLRVPSIEHYLTIDTEFRRIGHHRRGPDGTIVSAVASGESLVLDPPGLRLSLTGLFEEA
ncbi:MAG: Uma2 family endonuclease [Rhodomicrobium sp.]